MAGVNLLDLFKLPEQVWQFLKYLKKKSYARCRGATDHENTSRLQRLVAMVRSVEEILQFTPSDHPDYQFTSLALTGEIVVFVGRGFELNDGDGAFAVTIIVFF